MVPGSPALKPANPETLKRIARALETRDRTASGLTFDGHSGKLREVTPLERIPTNHLVNAISRYQEFGLR